MACAAAVCSRSSRRWLIASIASNTCRPSIGAGGGGSGGAAAAEEGAQGGGGGGGDGESGSGSAAPLDLDLDETLVHGTRDPLERPADFRVGPFHLYRRPHLAPFLEGLFARFDVAMVEKYLGVTLAPVFCTKIASKLCRTYTDRHGLKDVTRELLGINMDKQQQSSDWGADELSQAQLEYAASDVLHLHALRDRLTAMLERENRMELARSCFDFLPTRARLDLAGWPETDIFAHS